MSASVTRLVEQVKIPHAKKESTIEARSVHPANKTQIHFSG
jgi:hypothetical protein